MPAVVHSAPHRPTDRLVQVGVVQRDQCVRAAQLHGGLLEVLAGARRDDRASALAAGQRHTAHPRVVEQHVDLILGGEEVGVGALGGTCLQQQLLEGGGRLRDVGGVLDHDHIAGHQVRGRHPRQLVQGEVPRLHTQDHPKRGADEHCVVVGADRVDALGRQELLGVLRVVVEDVCAQRNFAQALRVELAHFQRQQAGELIGPLAEDGCGTAAHCGALGVRHLAPGLKSLLRLRKKVHRLRIGQVVKSSDDLVVVRVNSTVCHGVPSICLESSCAQLFSDVVLRS